LAYPQTSPEIYAWLPYHRKPAGHAGPGADAAADTHAADAATAAAAAVAADVKPPTIGAVPPTA
jgi:hypothetical protein